MKIIFEKWWQTIQKVFQIINYKKVWKENGNKPRITIFENGGRWKNGDTCFDLHLILGYTVFNYCNYALKRKNMA